MKYKTYDKWNEEGYFVMKGEKSHKRNKDGEAVFSEDQVQEKYNEDEDDLMYSLGDEFWKW